MAQRVKWHMRPERLLRVELSRSGATARRSGVVKGFGCRPGGSGGSGKGAGVRKPPKKEPAGKRVRTWPSMGIWRGGEFAEVWFWQDR